jgi:broad specificity phosphatase PhoE
MSSELLIIRHGLDDDGITNPIDGLLGDEPELTPAGVSGVHETAQRLMNTLDTVNAEDGIRIYSGTKLRTIQSAQIIQSYFDTASIDVSCALDNPTYGRISKNPLADHQEYVNKFKLAWRAFDESWKHQGNLDYRFGEPIPENSRFESLNDFIEHPYGESQREIYVRVYSKLLEIMQYAQEDSHLPIIVTHKTIAREIQTFIGAHNEGIPVAEYPLAKSLVHAEASHTRIVDAKLCIDSLANTLKKITGAQEWMQ